MRTTTIGVFTLVLLSLSVAYGAAPDEDDRAVPQGGPLSGLRRLFGQSSREPEKKPAPEKAASKKSDAPASQPRAPKAADALAERQREEKALQRRQDVILKLREIALQTNDGELQRLADQLDERVWAAYMQRIASLPASRATFESDERLLDRHLGPDALTGRPALPEREPGRGPQAISERDRGGSRTAIVEENR